MQTALDSGTTTFCHCWMLTRTDGLVLGFTDHDTNITFTPVSTPVTFEALTGLTATNVAQTTGFNVDNLDVVGALVSSKITEFDIISGFYDNAQIVVYRVDWSNTASNTILISGSIGEVSRGRQYFKAEIRSLMHYLNQPTGRLYRKTCDADLGDTRCTVNLAPLTVTATVGSVISNRMFRSSTASLYTGSIIQGWFNNGQLTWTSGANNGRKIEIKQHAIETSTHLFDMWEVMPYSIAVGDTFSIKPGCDKAIETCNIKFANVANFRGFPRMPGNDAIARYVNSGDRNDGTSLYT